jgi:hypothetical protein
MIVVKSPEEISEIQQTDNHKTYEIISEGTLEKSRIGGQFVVKKKITIAFYKTGDFEIGPVFVKILKNGDIQEELETNSIPIKVNSTLTDDDKDIKDLKNLIQLDGDPFYILKYIFIILAVIGLVIFGILWLKKRKNRAAIQPEVLLSPLGEFEKNIDELRKKNYFHQGKKKFFAEQLTVVVKQFLHRNYKFNAEDLTTYEVMQYLKGRESENLILNHMHSVQNVADLVKFAKYDLSEKSYDEIFNCLKEMIPVYRGRLLPEQEDAQ